MPTSFHNVARMCIPWVERMQKAAKRGRGCPEALFLEEGPPPSSPPPQPVTHCPCTGWRDHSSSGMGSHTPTRPSLPRLLSTSGRVLSSKPPGLRAPLGPLALAAADWRGTAEQTGVGVRGTRQGTQPGRGEKGKAVRAAPGSGPWSSHPSAGHHAAPCSSTRSAARGTRPSPRAPIGCGRAQGGVNVRSHPRTLHPLPRPRTWRHPGPPVLARHGPAAASGRCPGCRTRSRGWC